MDYFSPLITLAAVVFCRVGKTEQSLLQPDRTGKDEASLERATQLNMEAESPQK